MRTVEEGYKPLSEMKSSADIFILVQNWLKMGSFLAMNHFLLGVTCLLTVLENDFIGQGGIGKNKRRLSYVNLKKKMFLTLPLNFVVSRID